MNLFELFVKIGVDDQASNKISDLSSKLGNGLKTAAKVGAAAITAVTAATSAMATALVNGVSKTAEYGDNIDKMSQKMGMTAEAYQEWDAVMQHCGTSIDSMQAGMKTLATAAESGSDAFEQLGISQENIANMSQEELFSATIEALQNVESETERTYLAGKLLGRGATELGALLNTSAEDTQAMKGRVHELGGVMSDEAVKAAAAYQDSLQDMKTAFSGLSRGMTAEFMPSITTIMDGLTEIFSGDGDSGIALINQGFNDFVDNLTSAMPEVLNTGAQIVFGLVSAITNNLPQIIESGVNLIVTLISGLISAIPQLVQSIPQIISAMINGFASAWPQLKQAGIDLLQMVGNGIKSMFSAVVGWGKSIVSAIGDGIKSLASSALTWGKDLIQNFIDGIKSKARALLDGVKDIAQGVKDFLGFSEPKKGPLSNFHTYAPDMMNLFIQGIRDNENKLKDQIEKTFDFGERTITAGISYGSYGDTGLSSGSGYGAGQVSAVQNSVREAIHDEISKIGIYLDGNTLVGGISERVDNGLGRIYAGNERRAMA